METFFLDLDLISKKKLIKMCESIINDSWDSANISEYFSVLIGKEIKVDEDFMEVDKIICDYRNMMYSALAIKKELKDPSELYFIYPKLVGNLECQIIKGIEITLDHPIRFGQIKAYSETGKELSIRQKFDYFVKFYGSSDKISISLEKLREKNIRELKIISKDRNTKRRINVENYLNDF